MNVYNFKNPLTQAAFDYFLQISAIPRESGNEKRISAFIAAFAQKHGLFVFVDDFLNVLIKKPASAGREHEPPVILQAHMDMVAVKNLGCAHNFLTDPIKPVINGDRLKADGTSLGADNGCGAAYILAVLANGALCHPPIEAVFTSDEERGLTGALNFDASKLTGSRFINSDSEDDGVFAVSCAGSIDVGIKTPLTFFAADGGLASYKLTVKGLLGGHSGMDINKGRANAIILLARLLSALADEGAALNGMAGGEKANAIPREAYALISFDAARYENINAVIQNNKRRFLAENPAERGLEITLEKTAAQKDAVSADSARRAINGIVNCPNGPILMKENEVWASYNLAVTAVEGGFLYQKGLARFHDGLGRAQAQTALEAAAKNSGAEYALNRESPAWEYKERSPLRDTACAVYQKLFGQAARTQNVHAGLECAVFAQKMPSVDFLSLGPQIDSPHSPDESLSLSSFDTTFSFFVKLIEAL